MQPPVIEWDWKKNIIWEHEKPVSLDSVRSFTYTADEDLIFTSGDDRQVKLWDSNTGDYIESLRQNKDEKGANPIAYKKFGTKYIYATDKINRIDIHKK